MGEQKHRQTRQDPVDHDLDGVLDAALAKYAAVEPRAGLEGRILANLRSQPVVSHHRWWTWSMAAALAVILLVAIALTWKAQPIPPVVVEHKPVPPQVSPAVATTVANQTPAPGVRIHRSATLQNDKEIDTC